MKQAAEEAKSPDPKKKAEAMRSGMTFHTVLGDIAYDKKGDRTSIDLVWEVVEESPRRQDHLPADSDPKPIRLRAGAPPGCCSPPAIRSAPFGDGAKTRRRCPVKIEADEGVTEVHLHQQLDDLDAAAAPFREGRVDFRLAVHGKSDLGPARGRRLGLDAVAAPQAEHEVAARRAASRRSTRIRLPGVREFEA